METIIKRIIIVGKGGSGKNYLADILCSDLNIELAPLYTTRALREGEVWGKDYFSITKSDFLRLKRDECFIADLDRKWLYGIAKHHWDEYKLFILTPVYLEQIPKTELDESLIIYLDTDDQTIIERLSTRSQIGCKDTLQRRLESDKKDFYNFKNFNIKLNTNYNIQNFLNQIKLYNLNF